MLPASELSRSRYLDNSSLLANVSESVEGRMRLVVPVEEWSSDLSICISPKSTEEVQTRIQECPSKFHKDEDIDSDISLFRSLLRLASFHHCCFNLFNSLNSLVLIRLLSSSIRCSVILKDSRLSQ